MQTKNEVFILCTIFQKLWMSWKTKGKGHKVFDLHTLLVKRAPSEYPYYAVFISSSSQVMANFKVVYRQTHRYMDKKICPWSFDQGPAGLYSSKQNCVHRQLGQNSGLMTTSLFKTMYSWFHPSDFAVATGLINKHQSTKRRETWKLYKQGSPVATKTLSC